MKMNQEIKLDRAEISMIRWMFVVNFLINSSSTCDMKTALFQSSYSSP